MMPLAGTCDPAARALLTIRGNAVQFTPSFGVLVLTGTLAEDGRIVANLERNGADHKPYHLALSATMRGTTISGSYTTPRCRYSVTLATDAP